MVLLRSVLVLVLILVLVKNVIADGSFSFPAPAYTEGEKWEYTLWTQNMWTQKISAKKFLSITFRNGRFESNSERTFLSVMIPTVYAASLKEGDYQWPLETKKKWGPFTYEHVSSRSGRTTRREGNAEVKERLVVKRMGNKECKTAEIVRSDPAISEGTSMAGSYFYCPEVKGAIYAEMMVYLPGWMEEEKVVIELHSYSSSDAAE